MKINKQTIVYASIFILSSLIFNIIFGLIILLAVYFGWKFWRENKKKVEIEELDRQAGEAIDAIANSMRAGRTFQQALSYAAGGAKPPLAPELKEILNKQRLGVSPEDALKEFSSKYKLESLHLFVTAVLVTKETGGNLSEILGKVSASIREKQRLEGQIKTMTAQGRLSGWIVALLPFGLITVLYFVDRELILPMFTSAIGFILLLIAVVLELIGAFFIRKIVNIDI